MKILSKYKDFYDYLTGIYGVDPKLVLDRRRGTGIDYFGPTVFRLAICGNLIEGFFDGEKCYVGEGLTKIGEDVEIRKYWPMELERAIKITYKPYRSDFRDTVIHINPAIKNTDANDKYNCPIVRITGSGEMFDPYPKLDDYNIASIYDAETMFRMLSDWLSKKITESEIVVDARNDVEKLLSKGFDKKCSFRPKANQCT